MASVFSSACLSLFNCVSKVEQCTNVTFHCFKSLLLLENEPGFTGWCADFFSTYWDSGLYLEQAFELVSPFKVGQSTLCWFQGSAQILKWWVTMQPWRPTCTAALWWHTVRFGYGSLLMSQCYCIVHFIYLTLTILSVCLNVHGFPGYDCFLE